MKKVKCIVDGLKGFTKNKVYDVMSSVFFGKTIYLIKGDMGMPIAVGSDRITMVASLDSGLMQILSDCGNYFVVIDGDMEDVVVPTYTTEYRIKLMDGTFITIDWDDTEDELLDTINKGKDGFVKLGKYIVKAVDIVFVYPEQSKEDDDNSIKLICVTDELDNFTKGKSYTVIDTSIICNGTFYDVRDDNNRTDSIGSDFIKFNMQIDDEDKCYMFHVYTGKQEIDKGSDV